jgi:hypothetical protein
MAFVLLMILHSLQELAMVSELAESPAPILVGGVVCIVLVYWAYKVIWLPVRPKPTK